MDPEGVIKIFDFWSCTRHRTVASTIGFVGTRGFSAPEQYATSPAFTNAIDVYAYGATALYLATGTLPGELIASHRSRRLLDIWFIGAFRRQKDRLPIRGDRQLLDACLAKSPSARPPMTTVRDALARHLLFDKHQATGGFSWQRLLFECHQSHRRPWIIRRSVVLK